MPTATALMLALVLALTSVSMAVARGGMSLNGAMILCLNATQVAVPLGPDGLPQEHEPICPDCTMVTLGLNDPVASPGPAWQLSQITPAHHAIIDHSTPVQGGQARGPPSLI